MEGGNDDNVEDEDEEGVAAEEEDAGVEAAVDAEATTGVGR